MTARSSPRISPGRGPARRRSHAGTPCCAGCVTTRDRPSHPCDRGDWWWLCTHRERDRLRVEERSIRGGGASTGQGGHSMQRRHRSGLLLSLTLGLTLGAPLVLPLLGGTAAAADAENNCLLALCSSGAGGNGRGEGGDATANGGNGGPGGNGGFAGIHDVGNADATASSNVTLDNITTGDAIAHQVNVDARGATEPVVVSVAGSFPDT